MIVGNVRNASSSEKGSATNRSESTGDASAASATLVALGALAALVALVVLTPYISLVVAQNQRAQRSGGMTFFTTQCKEQTPTAPLATGAATPPPASILVAGQSNAVGVFQTCPNTITTSNSTLKQTMLHMDGRWHVLGIGNSGMPFGPELGVAHSIPAGTIAKVALGGVPISEFLPGRPLFSQIAHAPLAARCTLFWIQGETDAGHFQLSMQYEANFKALRSAIELHSSCKRLRVVSALLRPNEHGLIPFLTTVNSALRSVSDEVVETKHFTLSDQIHYDGESSLQLGRNLAEALAALEALSAVKEANSFAR